MTSRLRRFEPAAFRRTLPLLVALASTCLMAAGPRNTPERTPFTAADQEQAQPVGLPGVRFWADRESDFVAALGPAATAPGAAWLSISGGGEDGAYGAGLLAGWTVSGKRPDFTVVTGVSTGALIAPFAFVGPRYDERLRDAYTTITAADIFEFGDGGRGESLLDTWPLAKMIARFVTPELLADVAAGHREGRRLFVVTTSVDAGRPMLWDLGAIASKGGEQGLKLFRDVLLASCSVPGIFPPVHMEVQSGGRRFKEMHVDGGVTGPFYLMPPELFVAAGSQPLRFSPSRLYVILNDKLAPEFEVVQPRTVNILGQSLSIAIKAAERAQLALARSFASRHGIGLLTASIDPGFVPPKQSPFAPETMKALYELGYAEATRGGAFKALAGSMVATSSLAPLREEAGAGSPSLVKSADRPESPASPRAP